MADNPLMHTTQNKDYWVYILLCENQSYYTGYTDNLEKRFLAHCTGKGSKYTRSFKPIALAQCWKVYGDKRLALELERRIKKLSRKQKMDLVLNPDNLSEDHRAQSIDPTSFSLI